MFGIGWVEFVIILVFGFIIFGPDKLPEIAKTVASAINKFRGAQDQMSNAIKTGVYDPNSDEPFKNPLDAISNLAGGSKDKDSADKASEKDVKVESSNQEAASIAERKAKYSAKQESSSTGKKATPVEEEKPSVEDLYATKDPAVKPAAKKTVKRAPAKKDPAKTASSTTSSTIAKKSDSDKKPESTGTPWDKAESDKKEAK